MAHDRTTQFVGVHQRVIFESHGTTIRITEDGTTREFQTASDPLADLEALMGRYRYVASPALADARFAGGAVGFLTYDMVRFFEPTVPPSPPDDLSLPESLFTITDTLLVFDHRTRRLRVVVNAHIEGDADHPTNRGTLCPKGAALKDFVHAPTRLKYPMHRKPGSDKFERMSWEEAFDRIARLMKDDRDANFVTQNKAGLAVNRWTTVGMLAASATTNETAWATFKFAKSVGMVGFDNQARV